MEKKIQFSISTQNLCIETLYFSNEMDWQSNQDI